MATDRQPRRSALDEALDDLYQRPLAEFTPARNALAKTLTGPDAQRVKRLPKPTLIPWAINQVFWTARSVYDRLIEAGADVRRAQIAALEKPGTTPARMKKSRDQMHEAIEAHRKAVADAVHQAVHAASKFGAHPPADALTRMLESLSLAATHPGTPGRLTELVQPAGFEALTGVTPAFPLDLSATGASSNSNPPSGATAAEPIEDEVSAPAAAPRPRGASKREAAAAERERQRALKAARHTLAQARELEHRARGKADRAEAAVRDAERTFEETRMALEAARQALKHAQSEVDEAEGVRRAAEEAVNAQAAG